MNTYENLIDKSKGITIVEKHFKSNAKGLCKGDKIGISKHIETSIEKACILAEELGHHYTTAGNILDLSLAQNRKQERHARLWAYNEMSVLYGLIRAHEYGCTERYEIAEYLEVTEEFLHDAIECYRDKYGICKIVDNYIVYFIPHLTIGRMI